MDLQLAKKNAVVTGAANGVGRSIALCLSGEGVNVVISDIAVDKAENAAEECRALGGKGKILNITSQAAFNGSTTGHSHYAAAKSGVVTFTISMSRELSPKGINVNALALGMVETQMNQDILATDREYYEKRIQIGRIAKPVEVARFAVFLVSGCADYFTGATYDATGGMITR